MGFKEMMTIDNIKRMLITIAYVCYVIVTVLKNNAGLNLGAGEYVFVAVIGICLKLADSTNTIQQMLSVVDPEKLEQLLQRTESITTSLILPNSDRSICEPFATPRSDEQTHRDIRLNDQYIIRVRV
jgi:hypothetical protein